MSDLHGQCLVHLQPHILDAAEDLLLVARQGDPDPQQVSVGETGARSVPSFLPATLGPALSPLSSLSKS